MNRLQDLARKLPMILMAVAILLLSGMESRSAETGSLNCRDIADDTERLRCYDDPDRQPPPPDGEGSKDVLARRIEKERDLARRAFAIVPHRPSYLLFSYQHEPNTGPFLAVDPQTDFQHQEIKFQFSLRIPLWNKMLGDNGDLWLAYTQQSWWQALNWQRSAPFRETNYEPEIGFTYNTDFPLLGMRHRRFSVGFSHESNGQGEPLSRSWNRLWALFELERGNMAVALQPWYRIPEETAEDNNPDILDYAGRMELRVAYKLEDQVFSLALHNNLRAPDNHSGYELNWSFPFSKRIKGLVQFCNGYGESLIDYNVRQRRIGLGMLVEDWL